MGIHVQVDPAQNSLCLPVHGAVIQEYALLGPVAQEQILCHINVRYNGKLLIDTGNARVNGLIGVGKGDCGTVN